MSTSVIAICAIAYVSIVCAIDSVPETNDVASSIIAPVDAHEAFQQYVARYERSYQHGTHEFEKRKAIFRNRFSFITSHNSNAKRLWTAGINSLTDRSEEELRRLRGWRRTGGLGHRGSSGRAFLAKSVITSRSLLENVDWRNLSMASAVPDQGACGSCWAVAAATMLEARFESSGRGQRTFSAQQLVDCVPNPKSCGGSGGCNGATVQLAMSYVDSMGLATDSETPYSARANICAQPLDSQPSTLSFLTSTRLRSPQAQELNLASWETLPENEALPLMAAVSTGAVAVSVGASGWSAYANGIFSGCDRDTVVDHAVVLFGYGKGKDGNERDVNYWIIRNSWGEFWGEQGFIRLLRMDTPEKDQAFCGTDHNPKDGTACKPYPESVRVCGMCGILYNSVSARF